MKTDFISLQEEYLKNIQELGDDIISGKIAIESYLDKLYEYIKFEDISNFKILESKKLEAYLSYKMFYDHNIERIKGYLKILDACFVHMHNYDQLNLHNENEGQYNSFISQLTDYELAFYYYYIFLFDENEHKAELWVVDSRVFDRESFRKKLKHPTHIIFYENYVDSKG